MTPRHMQEWGFTDHIYSVSVFVVRSEPEELVEFFARVFQQEHPPMQRQRGRTVWVEHELGCALVIWLRSDFDPADPESLGILAHEAMHGALFVLQARGLVLTEQSEEAFAYYTGYLFREALTRLQAIAKAEAA